MNPNHLRVPPAAAGMRIGLLGGSFDPPHEAHRRISLEALNRLGLDQVWWLVSPRNPLKQAKPQKLKKRIAAARELAQHPRIKVTGFEKRLGSLFTIDTVRFLRRRFPGTQFVWLMGADNLVGFHAWRDWAKLFKLMPIAVFDRPGHRLRAVASKAAKRFAESRVDDSDARGLARLEPPAWSILSLPLSDLSSTRLRALRAVAPAPKSAGKRKKA